MNSILKMLLSDPPVAPRNRSGAAFTLVELLVATSLIAIIGSMTAIVMSSSNRSTFNSAAIATANASIDNDIAAIRSVAESYTCCPGSCTSNATTINGSGTCSGSVGDSNYYFPQPGQTNSTTATTNFITACATAAGITNGLISELPTTSLPTGVTRTAVDGGDITARRLVVTYTASTLGINRVVNIVPTVSSWCP